MALRLRWCVWWRLAGGIGVAAAVLRGVVAMGMRRLTICSDLLLWGASPFGYRRGERRSGMLSGPGGDEGANAISRLGTSSVGAEPAAWPLLWRKSRNHGSWPISAGKGQG